MREKRRRGDPVSIRSLTGVHVARARLASLTLLVCLAVVGCDAPPEEAASGSEPPPATSEPATSAPPPSEPPPPTPAAPQPTAPPPAASIELPEAAPRASRSFFGPHTYPPAGFAAYGIVAFPARAMQETRERYRTACRAYIAALPSPGELSVPPQAQMVTVWPVETDALAADLMQRRPPEEACDEAVDSYHLPTALGAINQAAQRHRLNGDGPFLLAWAPPSSKGEPDAPVLVADLSHAVTSADFVDRFRRWRSDIETQPDLWRNGWSVAGLRLVVRAWADKYGPTVLRFWES